MQISFLCYKQTFPGLVIAAWCRRKKLSLTCLLVSEVAGVYLVSYVGCCGMNIVGNFWSSDNHRAQANESRSTLRLNPNFLYHGLHWIENSRVQKKHEALKFKKSLKENFKPLYLVNVRAWSNFEIVLGEYKNLSTSCLVNPSQQESKDLIRKPSSLSPTWVEKENPLFIQAISINFRS